ALTLSEFVDYIRRYPFGTIPPDFIVLHHTYIPDASWAPTPGSKATWDANEYGMTTEQIRQKRLRQMDNLKTFYNTTLQWTAGPHLIIDDQWIFLLSPMYNEGIHAKWFNSFRDAAGVYHYSVGIEVVGNYKLKPWPTPVANLVGAAVVALQKQLGT